MSKSRSKLSRCIRAPIRALCRAGNFYMRSMTGCGGQVQYGAGVGCPMMPGVPRSYSSGSRGGDDLQELIRAASLSRQRSRRCGGGGVGGMVVARSQSVVIGRIDEEEACEFEDDVRVGSNLLYPRSRTCAVTAKSGVGAGAGISARLSTA